MNTKFRWYYKPEKKMVYPDNEYGYGARIYQNGLIFASVNPVRGFTVIARDIIGPMFFTGFQVGKNDLYKGDILKIKEIIHKGEGLYDDGICLIDFVDGQFVAKHTQSAEVFNAWYCLNGYECEIIGNEIEHKHLLESYKWFKIPEENKTYFKDLVDINAKNMTE